MDRVVALGLLSLATCALTFAPFAVLRPAKPRPFTLAGRGPGAGRRRLSTRIG